MFSHDSVIAFRTFARAALMTILVTAAVGLISSRDCRASGWQAVLRKAVKVADDVPLNKTDDVAKRLAKSDVVRESLEKQLRQSGELVGSIDDVARTAAIARRLKQSASGFDPSFVKQLDELVGAEKSAALILIEGGQRVSTAVPDIVRRGQFLQRGGAETVAAIGLFGDDAATAALKLDAAIQAGKLISPKGLRPATVADLGKLLVEGGEGSWKFVSTKILPHWDKWLVGGALAAFLIDPEGFINVTGDLTEAGACRLTELVGEGLSRAITGVAQGSGDATQKIGGAIWTSYFTEWRKGLAAAIGTLAFVVLVFPRPRGWLWNGLRRLLVARPNSETNQR